jgi:hypothetical protein
VGRLVRGGINDGVYRFYGFYRFHGFCGFLGL